MGVLAWGYSQGVRTPKCWVDQVPTELPTADGPVPEQFLPRLLKLVRACKTNKHAHTTAGACKANTQTHKDAGPNDGQRRRRDRWGPPGPKQTFDGAGGMAYLIVLQGVLTGTDGADGRL